MAGAESDPKEEYVPDTCPECRAPIRIYLRRAMVRDPRSGDLTLVLRLTLRPALSCSGGSERERAEQLCSAT
jgi:hypothetical protein